MSRWQAVLSGKSKMTVMGNATCVCASMLQSELRKNEFIANELGKADTDEQTREEEVGVPPRRKTKEIEPREEKHASAKQQRKDL